MKPKTLHWFKAILAVIVICASVVGAIAVIIATFHPFGIWCPSFVYLNGMVCEMCTGECRPIIFIGAP